MNWKSQTQNQPSLADKMLLAKGFGVLTPKLNVEPENHVFEEEDRSPNLTFLGSRHEFSGG